MVLVIWITLSGDPLDSRYVQVGKSEIHLEAGEGLFARKDIPENTIFALFSGRLFSKAEFEEFRELQNINYVEKNLLASDPEIADDAMFR